LATPPESAQRPTSAAPIREQPPIFVISLATATQQRSDLIAALAELGLECTVVEAVDARSGLPQEFEARVDRTRSPWISDPEYGCALSHAEVYRRMVAEELPHALVLEDDALPRPELARFVSERHYERSPLIQLYHGAAYIRRRGREPLFEGFELSRLATNCSGTVAYSLSLQAARVLAAGTSPVCHKADWPVDLRALEAALVRPVLVGHPPTRVESTLQDSRSKAPRTARRLISAAYYRLKWRRLWAQRVRSSPSQPPASRS